MYIDIHIVSPSNEMQIIRSFQSIFLYIARKKYYTLKLNGIN